MKWQFPEKMNREDLKRRLLESKGPCQREIYTQENGKREDNENWELEGSAPNYILLDVTATPTRIILKIKGIP